MPPYKTRQGLPMEIFGLGMDREVPEYHEWWPTFEQAGGHPKVLNLGAGNKQIEGTIPLDLPEWDAEVDPIPYDSGSVDALLAFHFLEHIHNIGMLFRECQRVLKPGGTFNIVVPYGVSDCALQDLDHVNRFIESTWDNFFNNPYYVRPDQPEAWEFEIGFNMIMGLVHRNLALCTQLIRK